MPAVVQEFVRTQDFKALAEIYDSLIASYLEDVEKYAETQNQVLHIRHVIRSAIAEAGKRIKFAGFGKSDYRSRDMGTALRTLEKALLIHLVYPLTSPTLPIIPDHKKSPRLQLLDTGMLNYFLGIQRDIIGTDDLHKVNRGLMIEHLTGQEILASQFQVLSNLHFWVREKSTSTAEVDFIYPYESMLVPIEVKSGKTGKLKSLHLFMDLAPHNIALRFYTNPIALTQVATVTGKNYTLLHLPYYLASQVKEYIEWLLKNK
jgi:predicted AAA+ superfamily ATPase